MVTQKGIKLAEKLMPSYDVNSVSVFDLQDICSLIARHATTHHRLSELECDGPEYQNERWFYRMPVDLQNKRIERFYTWLERRQEQIEDRIAVLVSELPKIDGQSITVVFSGDPRGCTVKLVMPDGRYDDWGHVGLCVPQDYR